MRPCPNGHRDRFVLEDVETGTGYRCPTCGASLEDEPAPLIDAWTALATLIVTTLTVVACTWYMFVR